MASMTRLRMAATSSMKAYDPKRLLSSGRKRFCDLQEAADRHTRARIPQPLSCRRRPRPAVSRSRPQARATAQLLTDRTRWWGSGAGAGSVFRRGPGAPARPDPDRVCRASFYSERWMQFEKTAGGLVAPDNQCRAFGMFPRPRGSRLHIAAGHQAFGQALQLEKGGAAVAFALIHRRDKMRNFFGQLGLSRMDFPANFKEAKRREPPAIVDDVFCGFQARDSAEEEFDQTRSDSRPGGAHTDRSQTLPTCLRSRTSSYELR